MFRAAVFSLGQGPGLKGEKTWDGMSVRTWEPRPNQMRRFFGEGRVHLSPCMAWPERTRVGGTIALYEFPSSKPPDTRKSVLTCGWVTAALAPCIEQ